VRTLSVSEAIGEALGEALAGDPSVFVIGEDIGVYGGAFGVTRGLVEKYGPERVRDAPISEAGFVGLAIGAALMGMRPVVEMMFADFVLLAMDQLVNGAAKFRYVYGPQAKVPMVVRVPGGAGRGYGPSHSQTVEAFFMHAPGLKIAAPATAADAGALLLGAIADDNPVVFVEHKAMYADKGEVPDRFEPAALGEAAVRREGADVTVVAYSRMVGQALLAAEALSRDGVEAEVVDLRTLAPLDVETVITSAEKTGRVLIAEEGTRTGGVAAEIGFRVFEEACDVLDAPIRRVTVPDIPIPSAKVLEDAALPDARAIYDAVRTLVRRTS
jgi:pyruvate/2-oxoglutarate/acetoin dehydrogenase E1 component